jgi:hypothetical protein
MSQVIAVVNASEIGAVATLTGNTGGAVPPTSGNINIVGSTGITVTGNPGTSTLTISGSTEAGSFVTNSGTAIPAAGVLNILDSQGTAIFSGSGNTVTHTYTDANSNTGIGEFCLDSLAGGSTGNTAMGMTALSQHTNGNNNCAFGLTALEDMSGGSQNCCFGVGGTSLINGNYNTFLGNLTGDNYTGGESSNICIGYNAAGVLGESNTLRIGEGTGTSSGQLSNVYISGINGTNVGSVASVVAISGDHLGSTTITAGTGISVSAGANTITIAATGTTNINFTSVSTSPYVVGATDDFLGVTTSSIPITIQLPNAPATGRVYYIKDRTGNAATNNITVTTVGGSVTIDGVTSYVMNTAYSSISVLFDGTSYEVF